MWWGGVVLQGRPQTSDLVSHGRRLAGSAGVLCAAVWARTTTAAPTRTPDAKTTAVEHQSDLQEAEATGGGATTSRRNLASNSVGPDIFFVHRVKKRVAMPPESWEDVWGVAPPTPPPAEVSARAAPVDDEEARLRMLVEQWQEEAARRSATMFVGSMICLSALALYVDATRREVTRLRQLVVDARRR